jgi:hypothetical protein
MKPGGCWACLVGVVQCSFTETSSPGIRTLYISTGLNGSSGNVAEVATRMVRAKIKIYSKQLNTIMLSYANIHNQGPVLVLGLKCRNKYVII